MEQLKGLILSGGRGTRLRPITHTSAKQLVPVANKPVLFYGIEAMAAAGIEDVGIIIAPETGGEIREAAGDGSRFGLRITYIEQDEPLGPRARGAHGRALPRRLAVRHVPRRQPAPGRDRGPRRAVPRPPSPTRSSCSRRCPTPSTTAWPSCATAPSCALAEKPAQPQTDLALVGVYMFTAGIHDAARAISPSARGELEITDAIQHVVDAGLRVEPHIVEGWWKDTGRLEDMLEANRLVLDTIEERDRRRARRLPRRRPRRDRGRRAARALARARPRDHRRRRAGLVDAYVGPYTAVGANCVIERAEVEHSILLEGASVVRPRRAPGVLAARPRRRGAPRRAPAPRLPAAGRRQLRHRDPLMRLLVTGAGGMLGTDLVEIARATGHDVIAVTHGDLDITDAAAVDRTVDDERPEAIVNCAAFTDVDRSETEPELVARGQRRGRPRTWRAPPSAPAPPSCTSPPTTSSTARRARPTSSPTRSRRSAPTPAASSTASAPSPRRPGGTSSRAPPGSSGPPAGRSSRPPWRRARRCVG